jgi:glycosyltransferase involved in cell wall biosynthesis
LTGLINFKGELMRKVILGTEPYTFNEVDCAIVLLNEEHNIEELLENVYPCVDDIIIVDGKSIDTTVDKIKQFKKENDKYDKIKLYINDFFKNANGILGDQKNLAISKTNSLFTLVMDGDERLCPDLVKDFRKIIRENQSMDVINFLRYNYIDGKPETLDKEFQYRLFKSFNRYVGTSHHELVGWRHELYVELPDKYFMTHNKSTERAHKNNSYFDNVVDVKYPHKNNNLSRLINYNVEGA